MSQNTDTIERYIDGFNKSDHEQVLSCLTDDVEWVIPGMFQVAGKEAFDKEIENDAFTGKPVVTISRMIEQGDVVSAEGEVRAHLKDGTPFSAVFCDIFEMRDTKIRRLVSYLLAVPAQAAE